MGYLNYFNTGDYINIITTIYSKTIFTVKETVLCVFYELIFSYFNALNPLC